MAKLYDEQTKRLKWIIKNWSLIKNSPTEAENNFKKKFKVRLALKRGLCNHCELYKLDSNLRRNMFQAFPKFSGSFGFPLSNFEDYYKISNFTNTPERLGLAKHCLKYLRAKRKEQQYKEVQKLNK